MAPVPEPAGSQLGRLRHSPPAAEGRAGTRCACASRSFSGVRRSYTRPVGECNPAGTSTDVLVCHY